MDYNKMLNDFVNNLPKSLWKALEGKYDVTIDLVKGQTVKTEIPVIMVYKAKEDSYVPFVKEIFEAFTEFNTAFYGNFEKYVEHLAKLVVAREKFCNNSSESV